MARTETSSVDAIFIDVNAIRIQNVSMNIIIFEFKTFRRTSSLSGLLIHNYWSPFNRNNFGLIWILFRKSLSQNLS